jgi:hypothetical protein
MGDIWKNGEENDRNVWRALKGVWILRDRIGSKYEREKITDILQ